MRIFTLLLAAAIAMPCLAATSISNIPGTRGVRIVGQAGEALGAHNITALGDVNGDGRADFALGAPGAGRPGATFVGAAYVFFGRDGVLPDLDSASLNGVNGFKVTASALPAGSQFGGFTTGVGDVNNDGSADLLIGSASGVGGLGKAYLIFGKPVGQSFPASIDISNLGSTGVVFSGASNFDYFGFSSVSGGGDLNGDGVEDIAIGSGNFGNLNGIVHLILGRSNWPAAMSVGTEPGTSVVSFTHQTANDQVGSYVSIGNDINNDGRAELFINANGADAVGSSGEQGKLYVVFGRPANAPFASTQNLGALDGSNGFQLVGTAPASAFGFPAVALGDFNGDGVGDFAASSSPSGGAGAMALIYGKANWDAVNNISTLDGTDGTRFVGEASSTAGAYLAAPGDINGDGKDDLIVGAPTANTNAGKIYVIYGTAAALPADVNFNAVESTIAGEVFLGTPGFAAGPVSGVGKFSNVDLTPDFIIASENGQGAYLITVQSSVFKNGFEN